MKKALIVLLALSLMGCATRTMVSQNSFTSNGQEFQATTVTARDRTGTELQHLMVMDPANKIVSTATASGRGIVAGMTDGTLPALIQAGGLIGMGAVLRPDENNNNSSGGVSTSDSSSTGGAGGSGGAANATGGSAISASASNACASAKSSSKSWSKSQSKGGGWTPPGQEKK